jgi:hypothetical protein
MNTEELTEKEYGIKEGILENKTVRLKPIVKEGKMNRGPKHIGYFMFNGAFKNYVLPKDTKTGAFKPILTSKEIKFFSEILQTDVSFNKKEDNFWDKYSVRIVKDENLMKNGLSFDLSDPYQNLDCRLMKALRKTAESFETKKDSPVYTWYIAEENEELKFEADKIGKTKDLWMFFGSIQNNKKKLIDILSVYNAEKSKTSQIDISASIEWFVKEVSKLITKEPDFVLRCKNDDDYTIKAFIMDGVRAGAINKSGRNKYNLLGDSSNYDYIGLTKLVTALKEDSEDEYFRLDDQIKKYLKENNIK